MNEISPWAARRKAIILGGVVLVLSAISFTVFWKFWYSAPTCFDNLKNGDETGVDCGGSCELVCSGGVIKPIIRWDPRMFEVMPGLWSVLVYVENPNINLDATYVPYSFSIYDEKNNLLEERKGATILPKNKTVGIFEGSIAIKEGTRPRRAVFEIEDGVVWKKNEKSRDEISVTHGPLLRLDSAPRVEANAKNNGTEEIKDVELVAVVFDGSDNAIAASRTFIESLKKNENTDVFFTWPKPFELGSKVCERNSDIVLALDRSGSMQSLKTNPPEPLSSVKASASDFVSLLGGSDDVGLVSFATDAKKDSGLEKDKARVLSFINGINIQKENTQYTNIADALASAFDILGDQESQKQKIIILLTDGIANRPVSSSSKTESEEIAYAENEALKIASNVKGSGVAIYTIGLGKNIHQDFLKKVASSADHFFLAPATSTLEEIYDNISSDICKEIPARIEITYKIFGQVI